MEELSFTIQLERQVKATLERTFEALLEQIGPENVRPDGAPMPMKIEPWPGGRWYRDLGGKDGHFWAHVQAIKRPTLLEMIGPLFMSEPVISRIQYRLSEADGGTLIRFHHKWLGFVPEELVEGMEGGWTSLFEKVRERAEGR